MKRNFVVVVVALLLNCQSMYSQAWEWVQTAGSEKDINVGTAVSTDASGNTYITGYHHTPMHLQEDITSGRTIRLINSGFRKDHMFVAKYDKFGNLKWANYASGRHAEGLDVASDNKGNVYVTGRFSSKTKFSSRDGNNIRMDGKAPGLMFLAKYDARGNLKWVVKGGSDKGVNSGESLAVDGNRIFVAGFSEIALGEELVYTTTQYDKKRFCPAKPSKGERVTLGSLVVYDTYGRFVKARFLGEKSSNVFYRDLKIDAKGNYIVSGTFQGSFRKSGRWFQTTEYKPQGFVMAFDHKDNYRWDLRIQANFCPHSSPRIALQRNKVGLSFASKGKALIIDAKGRIKSFPVPKPGDQFINVSQLDLRGNFTWHSPIPAGKAGVGAHDLDFGPSGNLFLTGHYADDLQMGSKLLTTTGGHTSPVAATSGATGVGDDIQSWWDKNLYVAKFDLRGGITWAMPSEGKRNEIAYGLAIDNQQHVYTTGYFNGGQEVKFGRAPMREFGKVNVFLARLNTYSSMHEISYPYVPQVAIYDHPDSTSFQTTSIFGRQLVTRQKVVVQNAEVDLYVWDNHQIDGDIISIYLNDSCIVKNLHLKAYSRHIKVTIPEDSTSQLLLVAENIGSLGPNTTAVTIVDGHTRQRVHLQSNMQRSEALSLINKPSHEAWVEKQKALGMKAWEEKKKEMEANKKVRDRAREAIRKKTEAGPETTAPEIKEDPNSKSARRKAKKAAKAKKRIERQKAKADWMKDY